MEPTGLTSPESDDLDAPAYTRTPTPLSEIERRQSQRMSDREDAGNRTFNRQFWFTLASEVGGVPTGMSTARLAEWVAGILARHKPGAAPSATRTTTSGDVP